MAYSDEELELRRILANYEKALGEPFPLLLFMGKDEELKRVISNAIETGVPYRIDYPDLRYCCV